MGILSLAVNVVGAAMLLLFGVKTIQAGVERGFGPSFLRIFAGKKSRLQSAATGMALAMVLQSSAAVALLSVSFLAVSAMEFTTALAAVLGADLGSAVVVQILSLRLDWLVPLLLAGGGWIFVHSKSKRLRECGRIVLGVALILVSLRFLGEALEPMRNSELFAPVATYLARDLVTSFLLGAGLALVMHSSVAVVLMCVAAVNQGIVPLEAGLPLVLGANLGSALVPVWLARGFGPAPRRVPLANFCLRGSFAVIALAAVMTFKLPLALLGDNLGQTLIIVHLVFNSMLLLTLPVLRHMEQPIAFLLPEPVANGSGIDRSQEISCLDPNVVDVPNLALASVRREILRMAQLVTAMVNPVMELYRHGDAERISQVRAMDPHLNNALAGVRHYVAEIPFERMAKAERRLARDLTDNAIDLKAAGDVVSGQLLQFAERMSSEKIRFSDEGWSELVALYSKVTQNMSLAFGALATDNVEIARRVVEEKALVRKLERNSRKRHFRRLRHGLEESFESSDLHMETLRALKEFNARLAAVSNPILAREGLLLETRLVEDMA